MRLIYVLLKEQNELVEVKETTFSESDLKERQHIEEWIRKNPAILGEDLLIIAHEYDKFEINERLDLLALDRLGNLVIIEVKRDKTGSSVDFQAMKYASYCSRLNLHDVLEIFKDYLHVHGLDLDAEGELMSFLGVEDEATLHSQVNAGQRIIIVGKEIDKRILSVCAWLYENKIDVKCLAIKPFQLDNQILVDVNQLLPPYRLEDYFISKKAKDREYSNADPDITGFFQEVSRLINSRTDYRVNYPGTRSYFIGGKFLSLPWMFVFAYSKREKHLTIHLESKEPVGQGLLKKIHGTYSDELASLLKCKIDLIRGVKNNELYKLMATMELKGSGGLQDHTEQYVETFVSFKRFIERIAEEMEDREKLMMGLD